MYKGLVNLVGKISKGLGKEFLNHYDLKQMHNYTLPTYTTCYLMFIVIGDPDVFSVTCNILKLFEQQDSQVHIWNLIGRKL